MYLKKGVCMYTISDFSLIKRAGFDNILSYLYLKSRIPKIEF